MVETFWGEQLAIVAIVAMASIFFWIGRFGFEAGFSAPDVF